MPTNNGLKVCTFNAKCDELDYKCCIKDTCYELCHDEIPDSLIATMLAVTILPCKADIYNIQNVKNRCVVEFLLKEIARVKSLTDPLSKPAIYTGDSGATELFNIACELNALSTLCEDGVVFRDALAKCDLFNLEYVSFEKMTLVSRHRMVDSHTKKMNELELSSTIYGYVGIEEYDAYYDGTCLTLVKKSMCLCPEVMTIPCVDSLVLFFEHAEKKFINVNINLGGLSFGLEDLGWKQDMINEVVCFLREYKDCGAVIMSGFMGDFDYETPQLLFRGDAILPEIAQRFTASGISEAPVPADFPCNLNDPIYELMEFLLKTCNAECVPYSWLLQYLRLKGCKKCCLYKLVSNDGSKCDKSCKKSWRKDCQPGCQKACCKLVRNIDDCIKCPPTPSYYPTANTYNRSQLRQIMYKTDKMDRCENKYEKKCDDKPNDCSKPACVPKKQCCCEPECVTTCKKCKVCVRKCECDGSRCEIKCKKPFDCSCKDSKFLVDVDVCKDTCKPCAYEKECKEDICKDSCDGVEFCDPLSILKREVCLYNVLDKVEDINNRYTGFHDHFNKCIDCKFPRGVFQAWAMCEKYQAPKCPSRTIDNNSELLALDHILVSDCLKNNVVSATLSNLHIEKCNKILTTRTDCLSEVDGGRFTITGNTLDKIPFQTPDGNGGMNGNGCNNEHPQGINHVPDFSGGIIKSFFTHRVYCVCIEIPETKKGCEVACGETLHGLGLTSLWNALCRYGNKSVCIRIFKEMCLDKHPFFCDFFYDKIENKFAFKSISAEKQVRQKIMRSHGACHPNDNCSNLAYIQKKDSITEEEFYTHLLCVLSNSNNRDRFVIICGFMEALAICGRGKIGPGLEISKDSIRDLFIYLDECFGNYMKALQFHKSMRELPFGGLFGDCQNNEIVVSCKFDGINTLICILNDCIINNCAVMEIYLRYAAASLTVEKGCGGLSLGVFLFGRNMDLVNAILDEIIKGLSANPANGGTVDRSTLRSHFRQLLFGVEPKIVISQYLEWHAESGKSLADILWLICIDLSKIIRDVIENP